MGCSGSTVGDGGKETEGEKGSGSPWSREPLEKGDQTGNVVLPTPAGRRDCWRQGREPGRRVLGVPGGRWGLGRGVPLEAWLEADGFREHNLE